MKRSEGQQIVKEWKEYCSDILSKKVVVSFGVHEPVTCIFLDVVLASVTEIKKNKQPIPDKRQGEEKAYTPLVISLVFDSFRFDLVIEDVQNKKPFVVMKGVKFVVGETSIEIKTV